MSAASVLIVEDEAVIARDLEGLLLDQGYRVPTIAATADEAVQAVMLFQPDLVLLDIRLGEGGSGLDVAERLRERWETPVIFLTAHADADTVARAEQTSPYGYLLKPFNEREIAVAVRLALAKSASDRRLSARERLFATTLRSVAQGILVTDSNQSVTFLTPQINASESGVSLHQTVLDTLPVGIIVYHVLSRTEFHVAFLNLAVAGTPEQQNRLAGQPIEALVPPDTVAKVVGHCNHCLDTGAVLEIEDSYELETGRIWTRSKYMPLRADGRSISHVLIMWEDITARKRRELEELARQERIIQHQALTLEALSTPLLVINNHTLVLPLIGTIDPQRVRQLLITLLNGVIERQARVVILDITGVPVVDTHVANMFLQAGQALALVGAQLVVTGIRPEVAQIVVGQGIDLQHIVTYSTLQDGIAYGLRTR